jgi:radical SAM protein with 4Fe4S-binding SPASM domain
MNILLTNFCNQNCPYCFAKGKLTLEKAVSSDRITLEELRIIIDFLKQAKETRVGILGGEPTLHPEFEKAVTMIIKEGLGINLFTNGLMKEGTARFLKEIDVKTCGVTLNINSPESYTKKEWLTINRTARMLQKHLFLGFNIYRLDSDMDFIVDFIKKYDLKKSIRLAIAIPIVGINNKYVELKDYPKVSEMIVNFIEKHRAAGVSFYFDCSFILCSFTDQQLGKLVRLRTFPFSRCEQVIDVGPGLQLWRCFATSRLWNKKLTDFKELKEIHNFYNEKFKNLRQLGAMRGCLGCEYLRLGYCSGGCLGHTLRSFKLEGRLEKLA